MRGAGDAHARCLGRSSCSLCVLLRPAGGRRRATSHGELVGGSALEGPGAVGEGRILTCWEAGTWLDLPNVSSTQPSRLSLTQTPRDLLSRPGWRVLPVPCVSPERGTVHSALPSGPSVPDACHVSPRGVRHSLWNRRREAVSALLPDRPTETCLAFREGASSLVPFAIFLRSDLGLTSPLTPSPGHGAWQAG